MLCGVASWSCVVWIVEWVWAGWGLALAEGWAADCVSWVCSRGWLACLVLGVGNTPAVVGCWGCCGRGGLLVVGASACVGVACCRGSGAVRPGCLARLGLLVVGVLGWVWVGWL